MLGRHTSNPFGAGYFGDRVSLFAQSGLDHNPPILCVLEWQMCHQAQWFFSVDMRSSTLFCPDWPATMILLISGMTDMCHLSQLLVETDSSYKLFAWAGLKLWSSSSRPL
jgi:hypothetical protein